MKNLRLIPLLISATIGAATAQAAPDLDRIHKDVTVMSTIINAAFEADKSCQNCDPKIEFSYLANQGAVFTVRANTWRSFNITESGEDYSFVIAPPEPPGVRRVQITEMVGDILDDVGIVMDEVGSHIELSLSELEDGDSHIHIDSDTRRELRALNRERRELEYQRREYEIELIHADEDERKRIERRINELELSISDLEARQSKLNQVYEEKKQARDVARAAQRKKAREEAEAQFALTEDIVLRSLCDYGTTLKHIPDDEHVSVVFERRGEDKKQVFVMEMDDILSCSDSKTLRGKSKGYLF